MVGMHTSGFDRLVQALDAYSATWPQLKVLIQIGSSKYQPRHALAFKFKEDIQEDIRMADIVVSHGSVGILDALRQRKHLIVVPRQSRYGECIDDHQIPFSLALSARAGFPVITDIADLGATLDALKVSQPPKPFEMQSPTRLFDELDCYLRNLAE